MLLRNGDRRHCLSARDTSPVIFEAILKLAPPVSPVRLDPDVPLQLEEMITKLLEKTATSLPERGRGAADLKRKRDTDSGLISAASSSATLRAPRERKPGRAWNLCGDGDGCIGRAWAGDDRLPARTRAVMTERDAILVTDFVNTTADRFSTALSRKPWRWTSSSRRLNASPNRR